MGKWKRKEKKEKDRKVGWIRKKRKNFEREKDTEKERNNGRKKTQTTLKD